MINGRKLERSSTYAARAAVSLNDLSEGTHTLIWEREIGGEIGRWGQDSGENLKTNKKGRKFQIASRRDYARDLARMQIGLFPTDPLEALGEFHPSASSGQLETRLIWCPGASH